MRIRNVVQLHTVNKLQAFGWPAVLAKHVRPYGKRISVSLTPPG